MFYNAAMQFDRDLNVAVIRALYAPGDRARHGWEMLAATGVRGLRLVEETDAFASYVFTEANPAAFAVLERNVHEVGHSGLEIHLEDATRSLRSGVFDYVDLDPFGTPAPFVAAALRALAPGGVMAVTATDMPVLSGVARGVCERRYGGRPIRGAQGPEGGLRILIAYLIREAARHSLDAGPILGYVHDHYVRAFLRTRPWGSGPRAESRVGDPTTWGDAIPELAGTGPYGPMWLGPLFDPLLAHRLEVPPTAEQPERLRSFLERLQEESGADRPFYYEPNTLASQLHLSEPPPLAALLASLQRRGFAAARSHVRASAFRTTAPRPAVYEVARALRPNP